MQSTVEMAAQLRQKASTLEAEAKRLRAAARVLLGGREQWTQKCNTGPVNGLRLVQEAGFTFADVAKRLSIKPNRLGNILHGRTRSKPVLQRLANVLNVSLDEVERPLEDTE